jgi:hypothetical protein
MDYNTMTSLQRLSNRLVARFPNRTYIYITGLIVLAHAELNFGVGHILNLVHHYWAQSAFGIASEMRACNSFNITFPEAHTILLLFPELLHTIVTERWQECYIFITNLRNRHTTALLPVQQDEIWRCPSNSDSRNVPRRWIGLSNKPSRCSSARRGSKIISMQ